MVNSFTGALNDTRGLTLGGMPTLLQILFGGFTCVTAGPVVSLLVPVMSF